MYLGVGNAARRIGISPRVLTELFYRGEFRDDLCPIVSGRRLIPEDYVPSIVRVLRRRGYQVHDTAEAEAATK